MPKRKKLELIFTILLALIYTIVPTDLIPDLAPVAGWIDDAVVILLAIANTIRLCRKS